MSVMHPKLHVVLSAKARHAEFKCNLCKKLFISGYYLNGHKSRRHSNHYENVSRKQEEVFELRPLSLKERTSIHQPLSASRRMEKLLQDISLDETQLFCKSNRLSSTSFIDIHTGSDFHAYDSVLSPITFSSENLLPSADRKCMISKSEKKWIDGHIDNDLYHEHKLHSNASHDEFKENLPLIRNSTSTEKNILCNGNPGQLISLDGSGIEENHTNRSELDTSLITKENLPRNSYNGNLRSDNSVNVGYKCLTLTRVQSQSRNLWENISSTNKSTQTDETSNAFIINSGDKISCNKSVENICTQTDEVVERLNRTVRTCLIQTEEADRHQAILVDFSLQTEKLVNAENGSFNQTLKSFASDNNGIISKADKCCNSSVIISKSQNVDVACNFFNMNPELSPISGHPELGDCYRNNVDNDSFEREFQESFEARKNLLERDCFIDDECFAKTNDISLADINNTQISARPNAEYQIHASSSSQRVDSVIQPREEDFASKSNQRYNLLVQEFETKLSEKLRSLGVDPNWTRISDKVANNTNALLTVRRINLAKKIPRFLSMRTMLDNTIDQILEEDRNE